MADKPEPYGLLLTENIFIDIMGPNNISTNPITTSPILGKSCGLIGSILIVLLLESYALFPYTVDLIVPSRVKVLFPASNSSISAIFSPGKTMPDVFLFILGI
jgi:hypothetical protein